MVSLFFPSKSVTEENDIIKPKKEDQEDVWIVWS